MPDLPKLTIGIPTLKRADLLHRAIDSCLRQTVPVHVIVADQGHTKEVAEVMRRYVDHPYVQHERTNAKCLWENWVAAAKCCETPYFAWLQDDDIIARGYAAHVEACFKLFPDALHWQARIYCAMDERTVAPWGGCFPWVPMNVLENQPSKWPGEILVPTAYLTSWALSPGVAFRNGVSFIKALDYMPADADLWAERTILAVMGMQGPWVADPVVAGLWIHHGANESYNQWKDQDRQKRVTIEHLDELMDHTDWRDCFHAWCVAMSPAQILGFLNGFECNQSRYAKELKQVMEASLDGRLEVLREEDGTGFQGFTLPAPASKPWYSKHERDRVPGNGQATADVGELVWR